MWSPTNKLFVLFLAYTVKAYGDVPVMMQSDVPKSHVLQRSPLKLIRKLMMRFVKPAALHGTPLFEVDIKSMSKQKADADLVVSEAARGYI